MTLDRMVKGYNPHKEVPRNPPYADVFSLLMHVYHRNVWAPERINKMFKNSSIEMQTQFIIAKNSSEQVEETKRVQEHLREQVEERKQHDRTIRQYMLEEPLQSSPEAIPEDYGMPTVSAPNIQSNYPLALVLVPCFPLHTIIM